MSTTPKDSDRDTLDELALAYLQAKHVYDIAQPGGRAHATAEQRLVAIIKYATEHNRLNDLLRLVLVPDAPTWIN